MSDDPTPLLAEIELADWLNVGANEVSRLIGAGHLAAAETQRGQRQFCPADVDALRADLAAGRIDLSRVKAPAKRKRGRPKGGKFNPALKRMNFAALGRLSRGKGDERQGNQSYAANE